MHILQLFFFTRNFSYHLICHKNDNFLALFVILWTYYFLLHLSDIPVSLPLFLCQPSCQFLPNAIFTSPLAYVLRTLNHSATYHTHLPFPILAYFTMSALCLNYSPPDILSCNSLGYYEFLSCTLLSKKFNFLLSITLPL